MNKVLILFAHPKFEKSKANKALVKNIPKDTLITFHDLYEKYPDFNIDVKHEQSLLLAHDIIVWHHPFYWYSAPAMIKQWIDMVLDFGWAYGPGGDALKEKMIFNAITSGGPKSAYHKEGNNRYTVQEFLVPFHQTARLCKMIYLPPFAIQGTHRLSTEELETQAIVYGEVLKKLMHEKIAPEDIQGYDFLNEWIEHKHTN